MEQSVKKLKPDKFVMGKPSQNLRGVTEVWCHTILLAARHKLAHPALSPASDGWYAIYLPRRDGRLSWPRCPDYASTGNRTHDR